MNQHEAGSSCYMLHTGFFLFDPEDGGNVFL
jgi:hypothetical protein